MGAGPARILIVDDDEETRETLSALLQLKGYKTGTAESGRAALKRIDEGGRPSLLLLDLNMPAMNGWELRAELLKDESLASMPVVLLSGEARLDRIAESLNATGYLEKPLKMEQLDKYLQRYCDTEDS